ncbi:unnamed protein product [Lymnaea stagnalis]|uniref:Uncharacterized protein n=1 Tax=Lymnaea stagnalis TaxID=6523 RepID=A0AAV2I4U2_LYMST
MGRAWMKLFTFFFKTTFCAYWYHQPFAVRHSLYTIVPTCTISHSLYTIVPTGTISHSLYTIVLTGTISHSLYTIVPTGTISHSLYTIVPTGTISHSLYTIVPTCTISHSLYTIYLPVPSAILCTPLKCYIKKWRQWGESRLLCPPPKLPLPGPTYRAAERHVGDAHSSGQPPHGLLTQVPHLGARALDQDPAWGPPQRGGTRSTRHYAFKQCTRSTFSGVGMEKIYVLISSPTHPGKASDAL